MIKFPKGCSEDNVFTEIEAGLKYLREILYHKNFKQRDT